MKIFTFRRGGGERRHRLCPDWLSEKYRLTLTRSGFFANIFLPPNFIVKHYKIFSTIFRFDSTWDRCHVSGKKKFLIPRPKELTK